MAYYQQVGRAGRALSEAVGVLMTGSEDDDIQENFRSTAFPFPWDIALVLGALCAVKSGLNEERLQQHCNLRPRDIIRVRAPRGYWTTRGYAKSGLAANLDHLRALKKMSYALLDFVMPAVSVQRLKVDLWTNPKPWA